MLARASAEYHLFEDPDVVSQFRAVPQGFLDGVRMPAIFGEFQNAPELFTYVRSRIDRRPRAIGQWFLTGSQESGLMRGVTESLAGRAPILELWPMSSVEPRSVSPGRQPLQTDTRSPTSPVEGRQNQENEAALGCGESIASAPGVVFTSPGEVPHRTACPGSSNMRAS